MIERRTQEEIEKYARELVLAHGGSVSSKNVRGKTRFYLQWKEKGVYRSIYLKASEVAAVHHQLHLLRGKPDGIVIYQNGRKFAYETSVLTGEALLDFARNALSFRERNDFHRISQFIHDERVGRVMLLYGLRRTGKTIMLKQSILGLSESERAFAAYVKVSRRDSMEALRRDLDAMRNKGIRIVYVDEVTLLDDFIDCASVFSDVYAATGMKIILSGTDSLGFWFASHEELYDRAEMIHTTFIPFGEHCRLLKTADIDRYIEFGGTLKCGERDFDSPDARNDEASFRDDETTRFYIDTAIARNIQHSLTCLEDGGHFRHLKSLAEAGELTNAINRIIEDMNHRFLVEVVTRSFASSDLGIARKALLKSQDDDRRIDLRSEIDVRLVTSILKDILDIREKDEQRIGITEAHIFELREYLKALELIHEVEVRTTVATPFTIDVFTQPGLRYAQAQALVFALERDPRFLDMAPGKSQVLRNCILDEVRGRLLKEIVLLETRRALPDSHIPFQGFDVFKLQFDVGEFDMVVRDRRANSCAVYEIKHGRTPMPGVYDRHLNDEGKLDITERLFGSIASRCVLYRGENLPETNGVSYRNVADYLQKL